MLDFTELPDKPPGEALEKLVREIGNRLRLNPIWSGRGADSGRDLLFSEIQRGAISSRPIKWLVSCKHNAQSGKSVSESDVGSVLDKVRQHKADGFLLVTTTIPGTALKKTLDELDHSSGGEIYTKVWDSHELTMLLIRDDFHDLLKAYFPESYERIQSKGKPHIALEALEDALPEEIANEVRSLVLPHIDRRKAMFGRDVWPFDRGEAETIDAMVECLIDQQSVDGAVEILFDMGLEFDAYMALLNRLHKNYPDAGYEFLSKIVIRSDPEGVSLNAFQFLSENYEFLPGDQIRLASYLDPESLGIIFWDEIQDYIYYELLMDAAKYELWNDIDKLSSHSRIDEVFLDQIDFEGIRGDEPSVYFKANVLISVELTFDQESAGGMSFPGKVEGHFNDLGSFIDSATVDTREYYE